MMSRRQTFIASVSFDNIHRIRSAPIHWQPLSIPLGSLPLHHLQQHRYPQRPRLIFDLAGAYTEGC